MNKQLLELAQCYFDIATKEKSGTFLKFIGRIIYLTSDSMYSGILETSKDGFYFKIENSGIASFQCFIDCHGNVKRKPKNFTPNNIYSVSGAGSNLNNIY